jgi:F-type H+-transporting ATPase subunit epsilon
MDNMIGFQFDILSAENPIFSGLVKKIFASSVQGDIEILYRHTPLLTLLKAAPVWIVNHHQEEEVFYISGGILEVQFGSVTLLADTAIRAKELDEAKALEAKTRAEKVLSGKSKDLDYAEAQVYLIEAIAQLKTLKKFRGKG